MSSIGGSGLGNIPLASSVAGIAQRGDPDRAKTTAAEAKFQLDQRELTEKTIGDIGESDSTGDRDADGRLPWTLQRSGESKTETEPPPEAASARPKDPDGLLGGQLDLEA